jgi:hypothetical protein
VLVEHVSFSSLGGFLFFSGKLPLFLYIFLCVFVHANWNKHECRLAIGTASYYISRSPIQHRHSSDIPMAQQSGIVKALNGVVPLFLSKDWNGAIGVEYGPKGEDGTTASSGTIIFEGTVSGAAWYPLKIVLPDGSKVDNLTAPGLGYVENTGFDQMRCRMTVAGGAQGVRVFSNPLKG